MTCVSKKSKLKSLLSAVPEIGEGPKFKKWVAGDQATGIAFGDCNCHLNRTFID